MMIEEIPYAGWPHNLRLANDAVELIITLEVGPRIISYRALDGANVLKNYAEQMGGTDEDDWKIRGGHRHWIAPEDEVRTYSLDNSRFAFDLAGGVFRATNAGVAPWSLKKETAVTLAPSGSGVSILHTVTNASELPWRVAPWALTVMPPGGICILPQPPLGEHPRDLLPNRSMILWPYTDMTDPRLQVGRHFITLEQRTDALPLKIGLAHRAGWAAYLRGGELFIKTVPWHDGTEYPDLGCNFETFTNEEMLEVETLGALRDLQPGESSTHLENWSLYSGLASPPVEDSPAFADWLRPFIPVS